MGKDEELALLLIALILLLFSCKSGHEATNAQKTYVYCNFQCITEKKIILVDDSTFVYTAESGLSKVMSTGHYFRSGDTLFFKSKMVDSGLNISTIYFDAHSLIIGKNKIIFQGEVYISDR
jgi:hypothetical protein